MNYNVSTRPRQGYKTHNVRPTPVWHYTRVAGDYPVTTDDLQKLQDLLDTKLSSTAQFRYAQYIFEQIEEQDKRFCTITGTTKLHWKDVVKLDLYIKLYGGSRRTLEENFGIPKSNIGEALNWIKYKTEFFHTRYVKSLSISQRIAISAKHMSQPHIFLTAIADGTHIKFDVKHRDNKDTVSKFEYISTKPSSKKQHCLNFVIIMLPNRFVCGVLWPVPAKISDSQAVRNGINNQTNISNAQLINSLLTPEDTILGDCNFKCFETGSAAVC